MALVLTAIIFIGMAWCGFHISRWAVRDWYPQGLWRQLSIALLLGIGITAFVGFLASEPLVDVQPAPGQEVFSGEDPTVP
jgi:hypothetical protein